MDLSIIQSILPHIHEIAILTLFLTITYLLYIRSSDDSINYLELLELLAEINMMKVIYGAAASAIIRCKENSPIIYELKRGLISGVNRSHLHIGGRKYGDELGHRLLNMIFGKEKISTTTIHTAMNEVKIFLIEKLDKTELYLVISTALFIFMPILTLLLLTLIKNNIIALVTVLGIGIVFEIISRVIGRWIKT